MGVEPLRLSEAMSALDESDLSETESAVLHIVKQHAIAGSELASNEEIADQLNFNTGTTIRGVMLRLERKGYVQIRSYQRGRQVYVKSLKLWTAAPPCRVPHWREVYDRDVGRTPSQPEGMLRSFPNIFETVNKLMKEHNLTFAHAQVMLMAHGVSALAAQQGA